MESSGFATGKPAYLWLTDDALDRIESAIDNDILLGVDDIEDYGAFTPENLLIGFGRPVLLGDGKISAIASHGVEKLRSDMRAFAAGFTGTFGEFLAQQPEALDPLDYQQMEHTFAVFDPDGNHIANSAYALPYFDVTFPNPASTVWTPQDYGAQGTLAHIARPQAPLMYGAHSERLIAIIRYAWTIYTSETEADVTATTVSRTSVRTGKTTKKNKARNIPVQVVDVRRPAGSGGGGSTDPNTAPLDHQYRWRVRGHWRMQWYGKTDSKVQRKIWIDEQVRGPEDKPIKPRIERIQGTDV
ncbi:MAG: hypothetical protein KDB26_15625 [Microthrixaceae bacterium]|nr:hypothetical protein [Microthrixaceae bacterium]